MTNDSSFILIQLISHLRDHPEVPAEHAISAILLGAQKMMLNVYDTREMLDRLRIEWGMDAKSWAVLVLKQLKEFPNAPTETIRELQKPL